MSTRDRVTEHDRQIAELARQIAGLPVREGDVGGDLFQVIRGTAVASFDELDATFQLENLVALEENARLPASPMTVANVPLITGTLGDTFYALYNKSVGGAGVDWEVLDPGSAVSTPPLRRFELTVAKTRAQATATAKFLDDAGTMVGDAVTLYDPDQQFSGQIADYVSGEDGFRGVALLRRDLGAVEADRWEIIEMDGLAEWVVVEWNESPANNWTLIDAVNNFGGDAYDIRRPIANAGVLTIVDPASLLPASIQDGYKVHATLVDPDTSPPTYGVDSGGAGLVQKRVRGQAVGNVLTGAATFAMDNLAVVSGDALPGSPLTVQQTFAQGYVDDQWTEAIYSQTTGLWHNLPHPTKLGPHLDIDSVESNYGGAGTGTGFICVVPSTLAGTGLEAYNPGTGVYKLRTTGTAVDEKVKSTAGDTTAAYLHDAINDTGTYDQDADALVKVETVGAASTDQKERAFFDSSAIAAYNASGFFFLRVADGVLSWQEITGYDPQKHQLPWHENGAWKVVDIPTEGVSKWLGYKEGTGFGFHEFGPGCSPPS